jgi:hypothetical protein
MSSESDIVQTISALGILEAEAWVESSQDHLQRNFPFPLGCSSLQLDEDLQRNEATYVNVARAPLLWILRWADRISMRDAEAL